MTEVMLRGTGDQTPCASCGQLSFAKADGIPVCKECLGRAVRALVSDKGGQAAYEADLLTGAIQRATGRRAQGLKHLPLEILRDLRRVVQDLENAKSSAQSKLRRYGLQGLV